MRRFFQFLTLSFYSFFFFTIDQLGAIPTYSLPSGHLCSSDLCRESLSWAVECCWNHQCLLWTSQPDGEMWSTSWQIHGLLFAVPWWCGSQRCECSYCDNQDQENHPVCGLVPNWIQGLYFQFKDSFKYYIYLIKHPGSNKRHSQGPKIW